MIKVHYRTLQRILDILPKKTYVSSAIDAFLEKIHQEGEDAIREITGSGASTSEITIRIYSTVGATNERNPSS